MIIILEAISFVSFLIVLAIGYIMVKEGETWMARFLGGMLCLMALVGMSGPLSANECIDTALVLMADVSPSMNEREQRLQREGYRLAFEQDSVFQSIMAGPCQAIAVRYGEFSSDAYDVTGWHVIRSKADMLVFGAALDVEPSTETIYKRGSATGIGNAMMTAKAWLDELSGYHKRVIDISSDGINNTGIPPAEARAMINPEGTFLYDQVQINGLPLLRDTGTWYGPKEVLDMFESQVISGPGAFIEPVDRIEDLPRAIELKLSKEIG